MALVICREAEVFERYIVSYEDGKESLDYDISSISDLNFYERIKEKELQCLTEEEHQIFLCGIVFYLQI